MFAYVFLFFYYDVVALLRCYMSANNTPVLPRLSKDEMYVSTTKAKFSTMCNNVHKPARATYKCRLFSTKKFMWYLKYARAARNRGKACRAMLILQTFLCGTYPPMAALIEGR